MNRRDTVRAYLRSTVSPFLKTDSAIAVTDSLTFTGYFIFKNAPTGTYYIQMIHRNSIETWSKAGGESMIRGILKSYDFTNAVTQSYGNNLIHKGTRYCIYSGDINQDRIIDGNDLAQTDNDASILLTGYVPTDIDGNNFVD